MQYVLPIWSAKAADVHVLHQSPRRLADLSLTPNTLSALILPDTNDTLLAAGGQEAERTTLSGRVATWAASGWMYDAPWDWARGGARAPGWGVRSVKFSLPAEGREVMTFTEVRQVYDERNPTREY